MRENLKAARRAAGLTQQQVEKCQDNKIQTGLRIPQGRYDTLKEMADSSGVSLNAMILLLVDIGMSVVNLGIEEVAHSGFHTLQQIDG